MVAYPSDGGKLSRAGLMMGESEMAAGEARIEDQRAYKAAVGVNGPLKRATEATVVEDISGQVEKELAYLTETISMLETRLANVLRPEGPEVNTERDPPPGSSPFAMWLDAQKHTVVRNRQRLTRIVDRLEF